MPNLNILVTDRYTPESLEFIKNELSATVTRIDLSSQQNLLVSADALLIRSQTYIDQKILRLAAKLKLIVTATSGYDHIDLSATEEKKITVMYTPGANTQSAAELTLFLILAALRRFEECGRALRDGKWKDHLNIGTELKNKTVGIIGLGRVGSRVARLVQAFGAKVMAFDPYQNDNIFNELKINRMGFTEVLTQADILTLHVPLTKETRRMIRSEILEIAQDGVILINTSRGKVVDESALIHALELGAVSAAGLDVFEHEPLSRESKLRKMSNVILSPHIGAYTQDAYSRASMEAAQKLISFFKHNKISDNLPLQ